MVSRRMVHISIALLVMLSVLLLGFVIYHSYLRFFFPFEFSKMEGCFADHARRVASGKPLYVPPSADWVPLLYMPLSHYVGGWICGLGVDGLQAGRWVSVLSILASSLVGMWLVARATDRSGWFAMVPVLIASTYFDLDCFYDQARPDNLMTLFCVLSVAALVIRKQAISCGLFVLFAVLAFFIKQSVFVFYGAFLFAYLFIQWRRATLYGVLVCVVGAVSFFVCDSMTDGWMGVYTFKSAASHDLDHRRLIDWISTEFLGTLAVPTIAIALTSIAYLMRYPKRHSPDDAKNHTFEILLAAAFGALGYSVASSWQHLAVRNVLILYAVMGMIFLPAALSQVLFVFKDTSHQNITQALAGFLFCLVVIRGIQDPSRFVPTDTDGKEWEQLRSQLLTYGEGDRAWVTLHGSVWGSDPSDPMHAHMAPLSDAVGGYFGEKTGIAIPEDLVLRIEQQWYSVIAFGTWDDRVKALIQDHYEPDPNQPTFRLPAFSGHRGGEEALWIPKRRDQDPPRP